MADWSPNLVRAPLLYDLTTMGVTIRDVRAVCTAPAGHNLIVVKVETSEPGLYGVGCATFSQRHSAVIAAIEHHYKPLVVGRNVSRIEELFQVMMVNGYWRNGPVLNNAISGIDMALWDIKGKQANMPLFDLFGGACRSAAQVYVHADGSSLQEVCDSVGSCIDQGYRFVRVQRDGYGGSESAIRKPEGSSTGRYVDPQGYVRETLETLDRIRSDFGAEIELVHDIHERLLPIEAVQFAKDLEQFRLFFLEDPLSPEDVDWLPRIRANSAIPIAMGELFSNPVEWKNLVADKLIDFIRIHLSQIGGITPARHLVSFANQFSIRSAWHGPGDVSPVGHAANLHLDLWAPNFGVQEWWQFPDQIYEIFPGAPEVRDGYMYANELPGLGIDIDERNAARYPCRDSVVGWTETRRPDGSPTRP